MNEFTVVTRFSETNRHESSRPHLYTLNLKSNGRQTSTILQIQHFSHCNWSVTHDSHLDAHLFLFWMNLFKKSYFSINYVVLSFIGRILRLDCFWNQSKVQCLKNFYKMSIQKPNLSQTSEKMLSVKIKNESVTGWTQKV